jgi:hypothetical protein
LSKIYTEQAQPWQGAYAIDIHTNGDDFEVIMKALETFRVCQEARNEPSLYIQKLIDHLPKHIRIQEDDLNDSC